MIGSLFHRYHNLYLIFLMISSVSILGEWKLSPFDDNFRFSFGASVFFFILLWTRKLNPLLCGMVVCAAVIAFRTFIDFILLIPHPSPVNHVPAACFYFFFSLLFVVFRVSNIKDRPILLGFAGVLLDVLSNLCELLARTYLFGAELTVMKFNMIVFIAIFRSYFVIGFFTLLKLQEAKVEERNLRKKNEQILMLVSNLFEETVHVKNSLKIMEEITLRGYQIYHSLKEARWPDSNLDKEVSNILTLVGQIHDFKKNNQRIYAGLQKVINQKEISEYMKIDQLAQIVINSNQKYAEILGKRIEFETDVEPTDYEVYVYTFLSLANNLVANAVEAIIEEDCSYIKLSVYRQPESLIISVEDNGPGVPEQKKEIIFNPGYTTKFDSTGSPSSGIGLTFVQQVVKKLGGDIKVEQPILGRGIRFVINIPYPENELIRRTKI